MKWPVRPIEKTVNVLDSTTHDPKTDDDKQNPDRHAANLAPAHDQPRAHQQVAGCAENQQYGQCEVQIHFFKLDLTKSGINTTDAKRLILGPVSQL